ncbi:MAG: hypothetical protein LQ352_003010 [Teloschistes flavicans]|nr:MAG: hypothetical protein LQ352_003010 [Teloschistes flavicans]
MALKDAKNKRSLPQQGNPQLHAPDYHELVRDRRLGQTNLAVKSGQVGTSNATKKDNLGLFDYAHLKIPFPPDFEGSEIHPHHARHGPPRSYFLMRRSSDGFVSASGMFRAAFPWARAAEEKAEKEFIKSLEAASREEVAGNIWVSEPTALDLAKDYNMAPWVAALLDPAPVSKGSENMTKSITPPPKYVFTANDQTFLPPPASRGSTPARSRGRPRNGSPAKSDKAASPRKQRATKASKAENAANAKAAAAVLQDTLAEDTKTNAVSTRAKGEENVVKLELSEITEVNGNIETTTTNVKLDLPGGMAADVPPQEMTQELMREAQAMVEETRKLEGGSSKVSRKRKAEELDDSDEEGDDELQPAKKARMAKQELKKERVKNRALVGMAFTLAVGSVLPYFL